MLKNTKKIKWYKTLSFPKFVNFYHLSVPQGLRISKIFFAILYIYYGKVLTDNRLRISKIFFAILYIYYGKVLTDNRLRISKIFFAILYIYYGKVLTDNRKGFFYLYQKQKRCSKNVPKETRKLSKK